MRSAVSLRWVVSVAATVTIALAGTAVFAPSARHETNVVTVADTRRPPASAVLTRAVDRTIAEGSARLTGTATSDDGTVVDLEGVTSFAGPESVLFARPAGRSDAEPIEVRTTAAGTWFRSPALGRWTAIPADTPSGPAARGWAETLARLGQATDVHAASPGRKDSALAATVEARPASVTLDQKGRIHRLRVERGSDTVEVMFSNFGVVVDVRPPPDL